MSSVLLGMLLLCYFTGKSLACLPEPDNPASWVPPVTTTTRRAGIHDQFEAAGPGNDEPEDLNDALDPRLRGNLSDPSKWDSFWPTPPGHTKEDYDKWIEEYKQKERELALAELEAARLAAKAAGLEFDPNGKPPGVGESWPGHWAAMGQGNKGVGPPPWAYVHESDGKPDYCFQPPFVGQCLDPTAQEYQVRWGFNPYSGDCVEFIYSGCFGNGNNFVSRERCHEACMEVTKTKCKLPKKELVDVLQWADKLPMTDRQK